MDNKFFDTSVFVMTEEQWRAIAPYLWLCFGMAVATIYAGFRASRTIGQVIGVVVFGGYSASLTLGLKVGAVSVFGTSLEIDPLTKSIGAAVGLFALTVTLFSYDDEEDKPRSEWLLLLMTSVLGMSLLPAARDFVSFFIYLETLAISGYILTAFDTKRAPSLEAGLKYLLMGAFSSGIFLMGITLLYGYAGTFDYEGIYQAITNVENRELSFAIAGGVLLVTSLLFKVALFPLHMWAPDVYQAAPTPYAAFLATATKLSVFGSLAVALNRSGVSLLSGVKETIEVLAILSIVGGSCLALAQRNVRRLFAYSGVVNAGYSALALAAGAAATGALVTNLIIYGASLIAIFAMIQYFLARLGYSLNADCEVQDLQVAAKRSSPLALAMFSFAVFSIAGIPPLPGFFGKYLLLRELWLSGSVRGAAFVLVGTMLGLAYYLKLFVPLYMDEKKVGTEKNYLPAKIRTLSFVAGLTAIAISIFVLGGLSRLPQWVHSVEGFAR